MQVHERHVSLTLGLPAESCATPRVRPRTLWSNSCCYARGLQLNPYALTVLELFCCCFSNVFLWFADLLVVVWVLRGTI